MSTALAVANNVPADLQEKVLLGGDLSRLTPQERLSYYSAVCASVGLNPLTRPFEYITLNGKLQLYTRKDCTDQLRSNRNVSVKILSRELIDDIFVVTSQASDQTGRVDESIGAVLIKGLQGTDKANAMMKAETKSKRRVTLSFCGLGFLDETELEDVRTEVEAEVAPTSRPDVGTRVLDKMKKNGNGHQPEPPAGDVQPDSPPARAELPAAHQDGGSAPAPSMTFDNTKQQFILCEQIEEASAIMNQWQAEKHLHTAAETYEIKKLFEATKKRLGKR